MVETSLIFDEPSSESSMQLKLPLQLGGSPRNMLPSSHSSGYGMWSGSYNPRRLRVLLRGWVVLKVRERVHLAETSPGARSAGMMRRGRKVVKVNFIVVFWRKSRVCGVVIS